MAVKAALAPPSPFLASIGFGFSRDRFLVALVWFS
jgi:hypothetical protein